MANPGDIMRQRKLLYQSPTTAEDLLGAFDKPDEWISRAQICGRVFRRVTPRLIDMIEQLASDGKIIKSTEPLPNGYKKFWYKLAGK